MTRFVFPELSWPASPTEAAEPEHARPVAVEPSFSEAELARAMGWAAIQADAAAKCTMATSGEAALLRTAERLAEQLAELQVARRAVADAAARQATALFAILARTCLDQLCGKATAEVMADAVTRTLAELPADQGMVVMVAPELVAPVAALLTAGDPGSGSCEVRGQVGMTPGDVAMSWPSGWSEWSFEQLRRQFLTALEAMPVPADDPALPIPAEAGP
ncbi:MAG TPA: hypothetical protein VNS22_24665 [Geminicoccus sp.]|uniref:hypothetical protein n=1 Tax=Geminicoccus sp. TaxID=2024832 RepID=UPI002C6525FF|nr:hypothetical protein [Geminicoccus sp.]HWL71551.1 hypothetical protein [Geminicoccus sp.]